MLDALKDVIVLDVTANVAGPYCSMILRDLGATVWKVEHGDGDVVRRWPPFTDDGVSSTFIAFNRGKESVRLDLKSEAGREAFLTLVERADVLVDSLRPGSLEKLGLGPDTIEAHNARIIQASISAFPPTGERALKPGFDAVLQAYTGIMDITGHPDGPPARVGTGVVDKGTGMWTALGILAALIRRAETGEGSRVSATLFGTSVAYLMHHMASVEFTGVVPHRMGTAQHNSAPYEAIEASDGWVMVGVTSPQLWHAFCEAIGQPELEHDPDYVDNAARVANRAALNAAIGRTTSKVPSTELTARLDAAGVPTSAVRDLKQLVEDPELKASGFWQPSDGRNTAVIPLQIDGEVAAAPLHTPTAGQDTREVLVAAGLSSEQIEAVMRAADVSD